MSLQRSIVYPFFIVIYKTQRKISSEKIAPLVKNNTELLHKTTTQKLWSHKVYIMSIVHHFFPLNVELPGKNFLNENVPLVQTGEKYLKKSQFCSHKIYMSLQKSIVHHFAHSQCTSCRENFYKEKLIHKLKLTQNCFQKYQIDFGS